MQQKCAEENEQILELTGKTQGSALSDFF